MSASVIYYGCYNRIAVLVRESDWISNIIFFNYFSEQINSFWLRGMNQFLVFKRHGVDHNNKVCKTVSFTGYMDFRFIDVSWDFF